MRKLRGFPRFKVGAFINEKNVFSSGRTVVSIRELNVLHQSLIDSIVLF